MGRPKLGNDKRLTKLIRVRVSEKVYLRLTGLQKQSNCRSICELARKILSKEPITLLHKDISMNGPMEELALIRKEIKAIGININQQTHYFHAAKSSSEKAFYVKQTSACYQKVDERIKELLKLVNKLSALWLQKS